MQRKLPHPPTKRNQRPPHHGHAHPSQAGRRLAPHPVSPHVFGKLSPILCFRARDAALPQTSLKSFNPGNLVQLESGQITPYNTLSEYPARQCVVVPRLQSKQMTRRDFCLLADLFHRDLTPLPLPSQLVAESFHSLPPT